MTANLYPGNPSLAPEVKDRVLTTFGQTLSLFDDGQLDEVVAGCDLILEMDDRFEPARKLRQKAKDPAAPVDLTELYQLRDSISQASNEAGPGDQDALLVDAVEALNAGNYEEAISICNTILSADPSHEEAQRIGGQANERLEADPFVRQFIQEADAAIGRGDTAAAEALVEKARSLDPMHPEIAAASSRISDASGQPEAEAPSSGFDFGGDSSPFAGAFGGQSPAPQSDAGGFGLDATPEPEEEPAAAFEPEPASFDFGSADAEPESEPAVATEPPDTPSPSGEASNFGFTLEEEPEQPPAVDPSEEPAPPEMIPGEAQTFDFSTGDVEVSEDDQQKIENYLATGDELFESGDYQGAIDSWSKIFLIDVTNEQASERIEQAKEKKRHADQRLDDLVTTGVAAYDRGDYVTARETFEEVLAQDPDNFRAGEYLEKLTDHDAATAAEPSEAVVPPPPPPPPAAPVDTIEGDLYEGDMYEEETTAPPAETRKPKKTDGTRPAAPKKSPKGLLIAVIAVVLLAVGGWFAWSMFSGGDDRLQTDSTITQGKINRAELLAENGDFAQAISILSSVEPGDPMREQALQLIAQYRQQQAAAGGTVGGRPMAEVREELLVSARDAFASEDYMAAKSAFEEAAKLKALEGSDREMYDAASRQVSKLDTATSLFSQGSYREAIQELTTILEAEPDNLNAREMLADAHFNLGVTALKNRNTGSAIEEFSNVLQHNPDDTMARRSLEIAQLYEERPKDLMYEIFVKYLPQR